MEVGGTSFLAHESNDVQISFGTRVVQGRPPVSILGVNIRFVVESEEVSDHAKVAI